LNRYAVADNQRLQERRAPEVADCVDEREHGRGDPCIEIACGIGKKRDDAALKPIAEKQMATNENTGLPDVEANRPIAAMTNAAPGQALLKAHFADHTAKKYIATIAISHGST
jgi:hypothetical protein